MNEHRPFTVEDGDRFSAEWRDNRYNALGATIAEALNVVFPEGLAVPLPAMRTTPVAAAECEGGSFQQIMLRLFPSISVAQYCEVWEHWIDKRANRKMHESTNTVLGLVEPELPLVTVDEAKNIFTNFNGGSNFEHARKRLEDFVRSKMPKPEGGA